MNCGFKSQLCAAVSEGTRSKCRYRGDLGSGLRWSGVPEGPLGAEGGGQALPFLSLACLRWTPAPYLSGALARGRKGLGQLFCSLGSGLVDPEPWVGGSSPILHVVTLMCWGPAQCDPHTSCLC